MTTAGHVSRASGRTVPPAAPPERSPALAFLLLGAILFAPAPTFAASPVGIVKRVRGEAVVQRGDATIPATEGLGLAEGDVLRTGADGALGVLLRDDTRLALGPASEVKIDRFAFAPTQGALALVLRMARGAASYVSGKIAKLAPDAVRIETPVASIGVRGTHFAARIEAN